MDSRRAEVRGSAGQPCQITLEQLAQPSADGYLMANDSAVEGGRFYTVERHAGYDRNLPMDAVVIHLVDPAASRPRRSCGMRL